MKKSALVIYSILIGLLVLLMMGCGKSLLTPLTGDGAGRNPELALERAEYLYLSGSVDEADVIYQDLMTNHANDPEQQEVYFEAVRGHSKCVLEIGSTNTTDVLKGFIDFALSLDVDTFETDPDQLSGFEEFAADFKEKVWSSFTILTLIPDASRTEADYANMSISGLFAVCADFAGLMGVYVAGATNVMQKIDELNTKVEAFNTLWITYVNSGYDTSYQNELGVLQDDIMVIYAEIQGASISTITVMRAVEEQGQEVQAETQNADNPLNQMLNDVFDVIITTINETLPAIEEIENQSGSLWENLDQASAW